jgi:HEPN domain-containing protein
MPPDAPTPGSPHDWIRHASSDMSLARQLGAPDVLLESLCFHTQQAAEKCLKAVLLDHEIQFPFTHNLPRLLTLLLDAGVAVPEEVQAVAELTEYAVEARYPGHSEPVDRESYERALQLAQQVLEWASSELSA